MTEEEALRQLGGEDENSARRAFDCLHGRYLSFGQSVLRRKFAYSQPEDRENALQQAFLNLWQSRRHVQIPDLPAWRGLLSTTVRNCYIDIVRSRKPTLTLDELDRVPPEDRSEALAIVDQLALAATIGRLTHAADFCWLGLSVKTGIEEHNRRLLAANYFYEGGDMEETLDFLNSTRHGVPSITRAMLAEWLDDPSVLLHRAYKALYYSPAALTLHLLGLEEDTPPTILDGLLAEPSSAKSLPLGADWSADEIHAILWRYFRNVTLQRDSIIPQSKLTLEELSLLFVICRNLFPFNLQMAGMLTDTQGSLADLCGPGHPGLWRRLAFQYCYLDELTHQDIEERIEPAARQVGFLISPTVLQGWLSSRRLLKALAQTCADLFEEYQYE